MTTKDGLQIVFDGLPCWRSLRSSRLT